MKAAVIVFPGSNREKDMADAIERATGTRPALIWHGETDLPRLDLIVAPGGFSYGDYLRCGAMAAHSPIMQAIKRQADAGVHVLGVCNGFQILTEAQLLPGALLRNATLRVICKWVHLKVQNNRTQSTGAYTQGQVVRVPMAHNEGNYHADDETLDRLEGEGRVVFRYVDADGSASEAANDNGSSRNIAGIVNERGNVLGLMPHPENATDNALGGIDGTGLFDSLVRSLS